ncbi:MAG: ATP-binding protein [Pseudohongiellaceae bacterium]
MKAERAAAVADSKAVAADNASERAAELASTLDRARSEVQVKAVQLQEALRESARLNDELQALNDTLEHRVADRSRELEAEVAQRREIEARLAQAQKMKAVGQLTAGIAHDFNNLLTVVLGNLEALHEQLADRPALARLAEQASAAGWRGATTTRRLLAFSRQQPLHPQPLDVPHLLQGMAGLMRQSLGETIGLTIESTADPWRCMADPAELETALLNLALNARDAMPNGGTLTIKLANVAIDDDGPTENEGLQPGQYVVLAVNDTGTGMTPETLEHVFEPFFTTKAVDNGSGLGLSMVHGFVHQSGGHVAIDSEPGAGTTVRLYLPRAAGEASTPEVCAPRAAAVSDGSKRILVVEDNDLVRQHVTSQLESLGYAVVAVPDAQAALAALQHDGEFDLLFSDVVMPGGMSGFDLAEAVQRSRPGLPVLLTSGYTEKDDLMGEGPTAQFELLRKPYRRHQLAERVRAALERKPDLPD